MAGYVKDVTKRDMGENKMKYRIFFVPTDVEFKPKNSDLIKEAHEFWDVNGMDIEILKVLPIDEDGFIIEQPKAHAPL